MTDGIEEVGALVSELKSTVEREIGQIDAKFAEYDAEVERLKDAASAAAAGGGTDAIDNSAARLDAIKQDLREMISRVQGIVADKEPLTAADVGDEAGGGAGGAAGPVSSDGTNLETNPPPEDDGTGSGGTVAGTPIEPAQSGSTDASLSGLDAVTSE